jgi:hypothetical protein
LGAPSLGFLRVVLLMSPLSLGYLKTERGGPHGNIWKAQKFSQGAWVACTIKDKLKIFILLYIYICGSHRILGHLHKFISQRLASEAVRNVHSMYKKEKKISVMTPNFRSGNQMSFSG